jgi:hypothetical protein
VLNPAHPTPRLRRRQQIILSRMGEVTPPVPVKPRPIEPTEGPTDSLDALPLPDVKVDSPPAAPPPAPTTSSPAEPVPMPPVATEPAPQ